MSQHSPEDVLTAPVPIGSFNTIYVNAAAKAEELRGAAPPESPSIGIEGEFAVNREASLGILRLLEQQGIVTASTIAQKLEVDAAGDNLTDLVSVAIDYQHNVLEDADKKHDGSDFPTEQETLIRLAEATGVVARAIVEPILSRRGAQYQLKSAEKMLENPKTSWAIGTIADHTLNALLDGQKKAAASTRGRLAV